MSFEGNTLGTGTEGEVIFRDGVPMRGGNVADLGYEGVKIAPVSVRVGVRATKPLPHIPQIKIKSEKGGGEEPYA
jgi:hypothetical protein